MRHTSLKSGGLKMSKQCRVINYPRLIRFIKDISVRHCFYTQSLHFSKYLCLHLPRDVEWQNRFYANPALDLCIWSSSTWICVSWVSAVEIKTFVFLLLPVLIRKWVSYSVNHEACACVCSCSWPTRLICYNVCFWKARNQVLFSTRALVGCRWIFVLSFKSSYWYKIKNVLFG